MKRYFLSLCLAVSLVLPTLAIGPMSTDAQAISRYTSTSMSCGRIKSAVRNEGAVILRWSKSGLPMYGRYVASSGYCDPNERAVLARVPAADTKACSVRECKRCQTHRRGMLGFRPFDC